MWLLYFVFFLVLLVGTTLFNFWSCGFFGGPGALSHHEEPATQHDRVALLFKVSCGFCCGNYDSDLCVWSATLLMTVVVQIFFGICFLLCACEAIRLSVYSG